jgi:hypothetical protein
MAKTIARLDIDAKQAEQVLERLDQLFKLLSKDAQTSTQQVAGAFKKVATETTGLEQATRSFLREQRFQDRVIRETSQTLTGLAFAFTYLTSTQKDASAKTKNFAEALMAGAVATNTIEMAMFSLSQLGSRMTGTLGTMITKLAGWGGGIAMIVGGLVAIISYLSGVDEETRQVTENIGKYLEENLSKFTIAGQKRVLAYAQAQLKQAEADKKFWVKEYQEATLKHDEILTQRSAKEIKAANQSIEDWQKQINAIQTIINKNQEYFNKKIKIDKLLQHSGEKTKEQIEEEKKLKKEQIGEVADSIVSSNIDKITGLTRAFGFNFNKELEQINIKAKVFADEMTKNFQEMLNDIEKDVKELEWLIEDLIYVGSQIGYEIARGIEEGKPFLHSVFKSILIEMINFLQRFLIGAIIQNAIKNFAILGWYGVLKAAAEAALITTLFETAKSQIASFSAGGYTGRGGQNEPAGIVHRGEVVFEKPIVDKYGAELMALRSDLQSGRGFDSNLKELKGLRSDIQKLNMVLKGTDIVLSYNRSTKLIARRRV